MVFKTADVDPQQDLKTVDADTQHTIAFAKPSEQIAALNTESQ